MAANFYNFLPIPEESRPLNDALQQIADSLDNIAQGVNELANVNEIRITVGNSGNAYGFDSSPLIGAISPPSWRGFGFLQFVVNAAINSINIQFVGGVQIPGVASISVEYFDTVLGAERTVVLPWSGAFLSYQVTDAQIATEFVTQNGNTIQVTLT